MIYKFISKDEMQLEVSLSSKIVNLHIFGKDEFAITSLNKQQVYDLIGALHILKSRM